MGSWGEKEREIELSRYIGVTKSKADLTRVIASFRGKKPKGTVLLELPDSDSDKIATASD